MSGEPTPLGLTFQGSAQGAIVVITGLVPGMTLSHGNALGPNAWQVSAADLANTWVGPPQDFVGALKLEAELHLPDRATITHQELVHEWIAAGPSDSDQVPIASAAADSEQGPTPTRPSESDPTSIASARADSEQQPIATSPSDSDQVPIASAAADSEQGPTPTRPSESDPTSITSARADSEQRPIEMSPAAPEQVSITPAPPKVVRARQQFEQNESATNVGEKPLAKTEQYATSG